MWQDWTNALLGVVVFALAFLGLSGSTQMWTLAVAGALIAVLGVWAASQIQSKG